MSKILLYVVSWSSHGALAKHSSIQQFDGQKAGTEGKSSDKIGIASKHRAAIVKSRSLKMGERIACYIPVCKQTNNFIVIQFNK